MLPVYSNFTFGSSTNYLTFNLAGDYTVKAKRRLASNRDVRHFDQNVPFDMGITDYETLIGKTLYLIEGVLYAKNEGFLFSGLEKIRKVFNPRIAQDDAESDNGYLPLKWTEGSTSKMLYMKPLYVDIPETRRSARKPTFKAIFKIKYPVITSQASHTTSFTPVTTGTGGIAIPSTGLAITAVGIQIGTSTGTGSGTLTNSGDYPAWPTITFTGITTNPRITNSTTGEYIQLNYALASSETATITYDNDSLSIVKNDGTNLMQYVDSSTDFFTIQPGLNQLSFTASNMGAGSDCSVAIYDSWPLS